MNMHFTTKPEKSLTLDIVMALVSYIQTNLNLDFVLNVVGCHYNHIPIFIEILIHFFFSEKMC